MWSKRVKWRHFSNVVTTVCGTVNSYVHLRAWCLSLKVFDLKIPYQIMSGECAYVGGTIIEVLDVKIPYQIINVGECRCTNIEVFDSRYQNHKINVREWRCTNNYWGFRFEVPNHKCEGVWKCRCTTILLRFQIKVEVLDVMIPYQIVINVRECSIDSRYQNHKMWGSVGAMRKSVSWGFKLDDSLPNHCSCSPDCVTYVRM